MPASTELHEAVALRLREIGHRYTAQRRALVEALAAAAGRPRSTSELLEGAGVPQSSAYRNLAALEQAGVVRRVVTDEEFARYELAEELTGHHHHLICSSCGRVEDVTVPPSLERDVDRTLDRIARRAGFAVVEHRLDLIGTCGGCAARYGVR
ncbi:MAG: hypothetical protein KatS3mg013_1356 [Actinomycetota bacterium]|jgi:Fur family ferric uptake transcriptional regulator|nr:MAG: hypothetical protein KatS3mg013_1356 [Actinomycetota bacterium]